MVVFDDIKELSQSLKLAEERAEKMIQIKEPSSPYIGMGRQSQPEGFLHCVLQPPLTALAF